MENLSFPKWGTDEWVKLIVERAIKNGFSLINANLSFATGTKTWLKHPNADTIYENLKVQLPGYEVTLSTTGPQRSWYIEIKDPSRDIEDIEKKLEIEE